MTRRERRAVPRREREAEREQPPSGDDETGGWSAEELLRHKDFAEMTPEELAQARRLIAEHRDRAAAAALAAPAPRPARRRGSTCARLVRASLATGGDPVERASAPASSATASSS